MPKPHQRAEIHYLRRSRVYRVEAYPDPMSSRWKPSQYWVDLLSSPRDHMPNLIVPNPPILAQDIRFSRPVYDPRTEFWDIGGVNALLDIYEANEAESSINCLDRAQIEAVRQYQERHPKLSLREAYFRMTYLIEDS